MGRLKLMLGALCIILATGCERKHSLVSVLTGTTPDAVLEHKVLLVAGQSNALGWGQHSDYFPEHERISTPGDSPRGPGYWAAYELAERHKNWHITVVNVAIGGSAIASWAPGTENYQRAIRNTELETGPKNAKLIGIIWYQGESDARTGVVSPSVTYAYDPQWDIHSRQIFDGWRQSFGSMVPVVFAQLARLGDGTSSDEPTWQAMKALQASISMEKVSMVHTDDATMSDYIHLDYQGYQLVGQRMARALDLMF